MVLYHRTNASAAILRRGFRDHGMPPLKGVWVFDVPLDAGDDVRGQQLLRMRIPIEAVRDYEQMSHAGEYRVFLVPARILNGYGAPQLVSGSAQEGIAKRARMRLMRQVKAAGGIEAWSESKQKEFERQRVPTTEESADSGRRTRRWTSPGRSRAMRRTVSRSEHRQGASTWCSA
jgi:hypothetical protein